jgi:hypothetical protein
VNPAASAYPYLLKPAVVPHRTRPAGQASPDTNPVPAVPATQTTTAPGVSFSDLLMSYKPSTFTYVLSTVGMGMAAFHGYRRNNSVGWALAWGFLGLWFPVITNVIAVAEGYAKPIGGTRLRSARSAA